MDFSKIIPTIAKIAPTIASLLGGPLAGMGVQALESVFGMDAGTATSDPAALETAVANMTPETAVKLAQINADLRSKLVQGGIDMERIDADDRASARQRESAVRDWMPKVLGLLTVCGFLMACLSVLAGWIKEMDTTAALSVGTVIGLLANEAKQVMSYYFGSTSSSKTKDDTIQSLSK